MSRLIYVPLKRKFNNISHEVGQKSDCSLQKAVLPRYIAFYKAVHNTLSFNWSKGKGASANNETFFAKMFFSMQIVHHSLQLGVINNTMTSRKINRFFFGKDS